MPLRAMGTGGIPTLNGIPATAGCFHAVFGRLPTASWSLSPEKDQLQPLQTRTDLDRYAAITIPPGSGDRLPGTTLCEIEVKRNRSGGSSDLGPGADRPRTRDGGGRMQA